MQRNALQSANAAGVTLPHDGKDKVNRNDWGYSIGGPIIKNKLFFFWSQEWNHEIRGITRIQCVPSAAEALGDFSQGVSCGEPAPNIPVADQAPGNPLKIANPSPAALLMIMKYPLPNQAPDSQGRNWSASLPTPLMWRQENVRVDYNLSKNNTFMGRFTQDSWTNNSYNAGYWGEDTFPALNDNWIQPSKSIVGKWTRTIGTTMVNDAEFSYSNNRISITPGGTGDNNGRLTGTALLNAISAAIPTRVSAVHQAWLRPASRHSGVALVVMGTTKTTGRLLRGRTSSICTSQKMTLPRSSAGIRSSSVARSAGTAKTKTLSTSSSERATFGTAGWATNTPTGNDLANLMIPGALWSGYAETSTNVRAQLRWHDDALYIADNWKVTPRLTLDLGLRWDKLDAPYQPNDQATNFQPNLYNPALPASDACNGLWTVPGQDPCGAANAQFGTSFSSGTPGPGRSLVNNNNHLFSPRLGIAWDPWGDGNTAVRIGAGRFFQRERVSRYTLVANAPFAVTQGFNRPLDSAIPLPPGGGAAPAGGMDPSATLPESWQWNVSIQRSLARDTTLELGYVGNHAYHQTTSYNLNSIAPQNWLAASFNTAAQNQTAGFFAFNNYQNNLTWWTHQGDANYHSLQALFKTRYKRSQLTAAYTWSHSIANVIMDDSSGGLGYQSFMYSGNPGLDRGNSAINRPHILTANFNYYLPDLNQANKLVKGAFGGWELGLITTEASGNSITAYQNGLGENGTLRAKDCTGWANCDWRLQTVNSLFNTGFNQAERPLVVAGQSCAESNGDQLFNPNAFTLVGYQIGTISPNMEPRGYCHGPSLLDTDLSIDKNFKLTERVRMQFRIDLFNAFNHANFRADNIGSVNGGTTFRQRELRPGQCCWRVCMHRAARLTMSSPTRP